MIFPPSGMLVVLMPEFSGCPSCHRWYEHPIEIDEAECIACINNDIAMLQIAMSHSSISYGLEYF